MSRHPQGQTPDDDPGVDQPLDVRRGTSRALGVGNFWGGLGIGILGVVGNYALTRILFEVSAFFELGFWGYAGPFTLMTAVAVLLLALRRTRRTGLGFSVICVIGSAIALVPLMLEYPDAVMFWRSLR